MEKSRKPKIRFRGYTDDWEQRKLNEFTKYSSSSLTVKDIDETASYDLYDANEEIGKTDKSPLFDDYISIIKDGAGVGRVRKLPKNTSILGTMGAIIPQNSDYNFLFSILEKTDFTKLTSGGTIPHIYYNQYGEKVYSIPTLEEQQKIGQYFRNLDNLITLHQRKLDKLINVKKSMLEKMFPKQGSTVPEIRFTGFTNDWEQRELNDIAEFGKGNSYSKGDLAESGTPIILYGRLYTKYETIISEVNTYVEAKEGSVYSKGGEVIVPASGETAEDIARAATVDKSGILLGGDLNIVMPNEDINSAFLAISISNGNSQRELAKKAQGKSVVHIHNEEIRNLSVPFPIKTEQVKIVDYFSDLDHLITLHQCELEKLQNIKKSMLEKMFV